mmetsp:Transcript_13606/g.26302  ORF Transcript_13606/g.26302 Transcript_13606/m.26302 type:complete len:232 (+) Transcript_13606:642-1337(+)
MQMLPVTSCLARCSAAASFNNGVSEPADVEGQLAEPRCLSLAGSSVLQDMLHRVSTLLAASLSNVDAASWLGVRPTPPNHDGIPQSSCSFQLKSCVARLMVLLDSFELGTRASSGSLGAVTPVRSKRPLMPICRWGRQQRSASSQGMLSDSEICRSCLLAQTSSSNPREPATRLVLTSNFCDSSSTASGEQTLMPSIRLRSNCFKCSTSWAMQLARRPWACSSSKLLDKMA